MSLMNLLLFKKRNHRNADFIFYVLVKLTQKKKEEEILNKQLLNANHFYSCIFFSIFF